MSDEIALQKKTLRTVSCDQRKPCILSAVIKETPAYCQLLSKKTLLTVSCDKRKPCLLSAVIKENPAYCTVSCDKRKPCLLSAVIRNLCLLWNKKFCVLSPVINISTVQTALVVQCAYCTVINIPRVHTALVVHTVINISTVHTALVVHTVVPSDYCLCDNKTLQLSSLIKTL